VLRTLIVVLFLAVYILLAGPPFILHALLARRPDTLYWMGVAGARCALWLAGVRVQVRGMEHLPPGPCIFVANHISNLDPPVVVVALPRRVGMLAKKEVFRIPVLATAMRLAQIIAVDRRDTAAASASVELALRYMKGGLSYLIFPEGTRSPDGRLRAFKKGSFVMAIRAGVPVVPVAVVGTHQLMGKGSWGLRSGMVSVTFGPSLATGHLVLDDRMLLMQQVQAAVATMLPPEQQAPAAKGESR
jgi:1-acyl-sn-glycerol-3-phosphate acyltransferase